MLRKTLTHTSIASSSCMCMWNIYVQYTDIVYWKSCVQILCYVLCVQHPSPRTIKPSSHLNPLRSHFHLCWGVGVYEVVFSHEKILTRKNRDHRFGWGAGAQAQRAPQTITFWITVWVILLYAIRKISLLRAFWYQDQPNQTTTTCDMASGRLWGSRGRQNLGGP